MLKVVFKSNSSPINLRVSQIPIGQAFTATWGGKKYLFVNARTSGQHSSVFTFSFNEWCAANPFAVCNPTSFNYDHSYTDVRLVDIEVREV